MFRFNGFTEKANNALNLAVEAAQELGHDYVGTEHLMLGLLKEGSGVASTVLTKLGRMKSFCGSALAAQAPPA